MTFEQYRQKVLAEIERRIGGKARFPIDEEILKMEFDKGHHYSIPAKWMIQNAIEQERKGGHGQT